MITNKTSFPSSFIVRSVEDAIAFFCSFYNTSPSLDYHVILCEDFDSLQDEWRAYYGYGAEREMPLDYDGQFLAPTQKTDTLTMLVCVDEEVAEGAERYYYEVEHGSKVDTKDPDILEERGLTLMPFFEFIELLLHEFSHLCSYDRMMAFTNWANPEMNKIGYDYHLHDEFIARIRGTEAMLRMMQPYTELGLLYSLYQYYLSGMQKAYEERIAMTATFIANLRELLTEELMDLQMDEEDWDFWDYWNDEYADDDVDWEDEELGEELTNELISIMEEEKAKLKELSALLEEKAKNLRESISANEWGRTLSEEPVQGLFDGSDFDLEDDDLYDDFDDFDEDFPPLTDKDVVEYVEEKIGHKLTYGLVEETEDDREDDMDDDDLIYLDSGRALKITDDEALEFYARGETERTVEPYMEFLKNPFAVYEGTQYAGMLIGFYRACCEDSWRAGDGHRDREEGAGEENAEHDWNLHLDEILDIPFWQYLNLDRVQEQGVAFEDWLNAKVEAEVADTSAGLR